MDVVVPFVTALVALRLAAELVRRPATHAPAANLTWAAALGAFAVASAATAWGEAAGWDDRAFRVYYLCGGMLAAALLGAGSLLRVGVRRVAPVALLYAGLTAGVMLAEPLTAPVSGTSIPDAQDHLAVVPARLLAIAGNTVGAFAAVAVAIATLRRRPLGNGLLLAGIVAAAVGSALSGLGATESSAALLAAVVLLYAGVVARR